MPELKEVFDMVSQQSEPDTDAWKEQERRQRRTARNRKLGAYALTATFAVVLAVVAGTQLRGDRTERPPEPGDDPTATVPERVAREFVTAVGAFDADQAASFFDDVADISGLVRSLGSTGLESSPRTFRLFIELLAAMRYDERDPSCREVGASSSGTLVRCTFAFQLLGSAELYSEPYKGSSFDLTVKRARIVRASIRWETERFSAEMWEAFARWVSTEYPSDAALMYEDAMLSGARLTPASIRLWRTRVDEFITLLTSDPGPPSAGTAIDGVRVWYQLPSAGWERHGTVSVNKSIVGAQGAEAMILWTTFPDGALTRPCSAVRDAPVDATAGELANAVSAAAGTELIRAPSDVMVGTRPAKSVTLVVREDLGCDPGYFYTWPDFNGGAVWPETRVGDTIRVWIVDVDGTLLFIEAETNPDADVALVQEVEQIIGSIRFG